MMLLAFPNGQCMKNLPFIDCLIMQIADYMYKKLKYSGNHNSKYYISILQVILLDFIYDTKGSHINYIDQSHKMEEKRVNNRSKTKDY
jgi:hypothetical protein